MAGFVFGSTTPQANSQLARKTTDRPAMRNRGPTGTPDTTAWIQAYTRYAARKARSEG